MGSHRGALHLGARTRWDRRRDPRAPQPRPRRAARRCSGVEDAGDLDLPAPSGRARALGPAERVRARSRLVAATRGRLAEAHRRGRLPLLVGGDCPVLLGALAAIRDGGEPARPGDARRPRGRLAAGELALTGEASDSEVAIALGLNPRICRRSSIGWHRCSILPRRSPWSGRATAPRSRRPASPCSGDEVGLFAAAVATAADPAAIEDRVAADGRGGLERRGGSGSTSTSTS